MNKDLQPIDELFLSALEGHEEIPSARVRENLEAALDKKNAESYKKRSIGWKRTTLFLLLIVTGFLLYESGMLKTRHGRLGERTAGKKIDLLSGERPQKIYPDNSATNNTNIDIPVPDSKEAINYKVENNTQTVAGENNFPGQHNKKEITLPVTTGCTKEIGYKRSAPGNKMVNHEFLPEEKPIQPLEKNSTLKIVQSSVNSRKQSPLPPIENPFFKNGSTENTKEKKGNFYKSFWIISSFASYESAGYRLDSDLPTNIVNIKYREVHEPSFSGGILLTRQLNKKWSLQTGIIYSNTQIGISTQKMYAFQEPAGTVAYKYIISSGYAYIKPAFGPPPATGDSLISTGAKHTLQYVSVPILIEYTISKNKVSVNPGVGIEANFLTSAKVETEIEDASNRENVSINKLKGARSFYWSVTADAEVRYQLNKKIAVSLRPAFRYAISPITKNNIVETFPHSFGLGLGIRFLL